VATPVLPAGSKQVDACDRLAASDSDPDRPPEVAGVALDKIDFNAAIAECETSIQRQPHTTRFRFNLGRAKFAAANALRLDDPARKPLIVDARANFNDAAKRGSVAALYSLATLSDYADASEEEQERASQLLLKAANQEFPLAMYELGRRYSEGSFGVQRNLKDAYHWLSKAEDGSVPAKVEAADALFYGTGVDANPRIAVELAKQAADSGSDAAKFNLGFYHFWGKKVYDNTTGELVISKSLPPDDTQALLWFGRAAADNNPAAQYWVALMMERGWGLPSPQPEIAEHYYRLAAHGGYETAEIELARRLIAGLMLVKPENGANEAVDLLNRALSHGSARAANMLAKIYRNGELDQPKDPLLAMKYAFLAMKLSVQANPTDEDGNPFYEIDSGIQLAEMAFNGQAVDVDGHTLLTPDEQDRLQRFYGNAQGEDTSPRGSTGLLLRPEGTGLGVGLGAHRIADRAAIPQPVAPVPLLLRPRHGRSAANAVGLV
jgi:TPR repeat protein